MTDAEFRELSLDEGREAIRMCNSFNRLPSIIGLSWRMEAQDWLRLLGEQWSVCDNIGSYHDELHDTPFEYILCDAAKHSDVRSAFMNDAERAALAQLPEIVTVYRGCYAHNKRGLSWSIDQATAEVFPTLHRYSSEGQALLIRATVRRADIAGLKLDRGEAEVVAERPKIVSIRHIKG